MEVLHIKATENSPKILFDYQNDVFEISGESRPENVRAFFNPVFQWLDVFEKKTKKLPASKVVKFSFMFEYFNSASALYIMNLMSKLNEIQQQNTALKLEICWFYQEDDEDMFDAGKEFESIIALPFHFITIK